MNAWKLNEFSARVNQPDGFIGELYDHQSAMLRRALDIENNNNQFGFLSDNPGSGKTNVIISLVLTDIQMGYNDRQTMIIVPQNIIKQWMEQIQLFTDGRIKVKELTYEDINNIENKGSIETLSKYNILITTNSLFETIMSSLSSNGSKIFRIVYDEIDTMESELNALQTKKSVLQKAKKNLMDENNKKGIKTVDFIPSVLDKGLKNKITWFMSASIYNMIDRQNGFVFLGKQIPTNELSNYFIKCTNDFIENSLPEMEEEEEEIYECECIADKYEHLLSGEEHLDAINSLSYDEIKIKNRRKVPSTELELLKMLVKQYYTDKSDILEIIEDIKRKMKTFNVTEEDTHHPLMKQILNKKKDYQFADNITNGFHRVGCQRGDCENKEECTYSSFEKRQKEIHAHEKLKIINDVLIECKKSPVKAQILIFSDFQGSFKYMPSLIEKLGMTYEDLCKGTAQGINNAIAKYKRGETEILFIQSRTDGCGLNLQNTTHLIFVHRTDERLRDQIIGRAQRTPREGQLKIISLYNKNEILEEDDKE